MAVNLSNAKNFKTLGILVPINSSRIDGTLDPSVTTLEKVKSQLYTLLFTSKGDRPMLPTFGVEIYSSLFENFSEGLLSELKKDIRKQAAVHVPEANILEINADQSENKLNLEVKFNLKGNESLEDSIVITVR